MHNYYELRPKVIHDYFIRHKSMWARMMAHINKRNELHQELNQNYGFMDSDGTAGIGKKSYTDAEYVKQYDDIERHYMTLYENESKQEAELDKTSLSVYEYLLIDNAHNVEAVLLASADEYINDRWHDFIKVRAHAQINHFKSGHTIGGIQALIRHEMIDFKYRVSRARKLLGISIFNIPFVLAIWRFRQRYHGELQKAFSAMEAVA